MWSEALNCVCFGRISEQTATFASYSINRLVLYNRSGVFTIRYALRPYIKQTRFVFEVLRLWQSLCWNTKRLQPWNRRDKSGVNSYSIDTTFKTWIQGTIGRRGRKWYDNSKKTLNDYVRGSHSRHLLTQYLCSQWAHVRISLLLAAHITGPHIKLPTTGMGVER